MVIEANRPSGTNDQPQLVTPHSLTAVIGVDHIERRSR
jgi:hypothetical protein